MTAARVRTWSPLARAHRLLDQAIDALCDAAGAGGDDELLSVLTVCAGAVRRLGRVSVAAVDNLVMLSRAHHRQIHSTDWIVRIRDGLPEFIPPAWMDAQRRPRRRALPHLSGVA